MEEVSMAEHVGKELIGLEIFCAVNAVKGKQITQPRQDFLDNKDNDIDKDQVSNYRGKSEHKWILSGGYG